MPDYITQKDLSDCKEKADEKAQKDRHDFGSKMQVQILRLDEKIDDKHTDIALLKQSATHMQTDITELKKSQKEWFEKISKAIEWLETKFATKAEFKWNKDRIDWFTKLLWIVWTLIITAILWAILKLIII